MLHYVDMADQLGLDKVRVLQFLFYLGNLDLGTDYAVASLTEDQRSMLSDFREFGLIYQRKKASRRYYPTALAALLGGGSGRLRGDEMRQAFVVIETNYRVYAYTGSSPSLQCCVIADSPLQIAVLGLFTQLKYRFANMVVGVMTRDSVRQALMQGITAAQIVGYLTTHAHTQMLKKVSIISTADG
jgi:transcription initiation factor TFIIH subunit 4